jgi:hypothetical protein
VTKAVNIKIKNFGAVNETEVPYTVTATCSDENNNSVFECGLVSFSAACSGDAATVNGGPITPGQVVTVPGCNVTYTGSTGGDKWLVTLSIGHCGTDGTVLTCSTNDGADDSNLSNNIASKKVLVVP